MYRLFRPHLLFDKGNTLPSQEGYIERTYREKLKVLRAYYRERNFFIRNDFILIRLLLMGLGSLKTDYETFVWTAVNRSDALIKHFQFTGSASYGKIWYGTFYGEGSYEIIIGDDADFDIQNAIKNWKELEPVRVLTHAISDFGLSLPNGKNNHYVDGLSVIYINIPMLMLQYRLFIEDQNRKRALGQDEGIISPKLFLYRYVIPSMMVSHLDHVFVNRIINLFEGMPMSEALTKNPFFQAEAQSGEGSGLVLAVDRAQETVLDKIRSQVDYDQILTNIFTVTSGNAFELLMMPDMAPTRQVWWALLLTRLKHMKFLLQVTKASRSNQNRMYQNRLFIDLTRLKDSHVLERMLTVEVLEQVLQDIDDTLALAKE